MTSTVGAQVTATALQGNTSCGAMTPDNANGNTGAHKDFNEGLGVTHRLYSMKDFDTDDLGNGKWVGVVYRSDHLTNVSSALFPPLNSEQYGCLMFIKYFDAAMAAVSSEAFFMVKNARFPWKLLRSAICEHDGWTHPPNTAPHLEPDAGNCKTGSLVTVTISSTSDVPLTVQYTTTGRGTKDDLRAALAGDSRFNTQYGTAGINSLAAAFASAGPWFPCAAAGCCRVF
jgi:hypothetical protein